MNDYGRCESWWRGPVRVAKLLLQLGSRKSPRVFCEHPVSYFDATVAAVKLSIAKVHGCRL
jgi:hypothetical protein